MPERSILIEGAGDSSPDKQQEQACSPTVGSRNIRAAAVSRPVEYLLPMSLDQPTINQ